MTTTSTPARRDDERRPLERTVIEHPSGGSGVVFYEPSDDLAMTAFVAVDADAVFDLATMR
ncbi:hypothetical protein N0B31_03050 [Salinirubellus salinus]|jgi:hypothetical protein|uniref:Uncharacterized protein n=1 Tax=Salinirubellus salinus TaxID=1364945 RepID=A0A9E7R5V1_9EURY|nr:hypothetical protein [Salinirubellus salinus]UWM55268.1 hypothetical protein N0B31_03050 [Salinirubellus salinus]